MNEFYREFDEERLERPEPPRQGEHRGAFQIDRDRIIHTSSFRRLQNKTQVFFSGEYDFYRTRLTHSIERNPLRGLPGPRDGGKPRPAVTNPRSGAWSA